MHEIVFENITELKTPAGSFTLTSSDGTPVHFSVIKNGFNMPYEVYDNGNKNIVGLIEIETNYEVRIDTSCLNKDRIYSLRFSEKGMKHCGSDEYTDAFAVTIDGWSVGMSCFNPNYYDEVYLPPDKITYREYRIFNFDYNPFESEFRFQYIDRKHPYIYFPVAWVKNDIYDKDTYEDALAFWLT